MVSLPALTLPGSVVLLVCRRFACLCYRGMATPVASNSQFAACASATGKPEETGCTALTGSTLHSCRQPRHAHAPCCTLPQPASPPDPHAGDGHPRNVAGGVSAGADSLLWTCVVSYVADWHMLAAACSVDPQTASRYMLALDVSQGRHCCDSPVPREDPAWPVPL